MLCLRQSRQWSKNPKLPQAKQPWVCGISRGKNFPGVCQRYPDVGREFPNENPAVLFEVLDLGSVIQLDSLFSRCYLHSIRKQTLKKLIYWRLLTIWRQCAILADFQFRTQQRQCGIISSKISSVSNVWSQLEWIELWNKYLARKQQFNKKVAQRN